MVTPARPGGYNYRQQINRTRRANNHARGYVARLLEEHPGPALAAMYLAHVAVSLGEIADAVTQLEQIANCQKEQTA